MYLGKINHKLVPLAHKLESGDQVEIITSDNQWPKAEWIDFCYTAKAKHRLRTYLKKDRRLLAERGETIFRELLKKEEIEISNELISKLLAAHHLRKREELYVMLAADEINLNPRELHEINSNRKSLVKKLLRNPFSSKKKSSIERKTEPIDRKKTYILHPDDIEPNYRLDTCCAPLPGDDVLGFVDENEEVVVHKLNCPKAMKLKSAFGSRLVVTKWGGVAEKFMATITLDGLDRQGILEEISDVVSRKLGLNLRSLNISTENEVFHCQMSLQVDSVDTVEHLCDSLREIKDVKFAKRTS